MGARAASSSQKFWISKALLMKRFIVIGTTLTLLAMLALPFPADAGGNVSIARQYSPSADAAQSTGDGNGFETTPGNAYADGGGYAVDTDSGGNANSADNNNADKHVFSGYGISIPTGSTIAGITVRADIAVDAVTDGARTAIKLSYDGGTTWTAVKTNTLTATAETTYNYGGSADTWGRTWTASELSDANFRVMVINQDTASSQSLRDFSLDWLPVSVTFTAPWDSYQSDYTTVRDSYNGSYTTVYMNGTGFAAATYNVAFYDGGVSGGQKVATVTDISLTGGELRTSLYLFDKTTATAGTWHAVAQPSGSTAFPQDYNTVTSAPDTYGLLGNDSFSVEVSAIPEFPTIISAIMTMALCAVGYWWMKKKKLKFQTG
ncbi:MAG: hypothetical protein HYX79_04145 [Chloroflexi bacterium]|nr:hypothetical protein [Chloroflexota bacterium]